MGNFVAKISREGRQGNSEMAAKKQRDTRRISEMRNLGPACERDLNAVGIATAEDLLALGPEAAFIKLLQGRVERGMTTNGCNAAYLYALYGAIHDISWLELPAETKSEFKALAAELRNSYPFSSSRRRR